MELSESVHPLDPSTKIVSQHLVWGGKVEASLVNLSTQQKRAIDIGIL